MVESEPGHQKLIRRPNRVQGVTGRLVCMRADLLRLARETPELAALDLDFKSLFISWFNRGFLVLRPINWESPAHILEKIIAYEAVSAIDSSEDLRRRLEPEGRRCFAFFQPAMPDEPLIFVEVALTNGIPTSVQALLAHNRDVTRADEADTAMFYSISNCQIGLASISFGNSLIKKVASDLSVENAGLSTFVTLSPIPGLMGCLDQEAQAWNVDNPSEVAKIAAYYLLLAKTKSRLPCDPVARLHPRNGAIIHAVHSEADTSENCRALSGGTTVNYLYDLNKVEQNHKDFASTQKITATAAMMSLASASSALCVGER